MSILAIKQQVCYNFHRKTNRNDYMSEFLKKNVNLFLGIFLVLQPILDLLTGLCLHLLNINLTIGIIIRVIFLIIICFTALFIFKKKKLLIPYTIIGIYFILYILGIIIYKDGIGLFREIQGLIKVFYFPILLVTFYSIRDKIRISKLTLFTTLFLYLIFIFVPLLLGLGYQSYQITKAGTLGFYNSANEISGIISILTPIMFIILSSSKKIVPKLILILMYLVVILMIGTKTPLLTLVITLGFSLIYFWSKSIKEKQFKNIFISIFILLIGMGSLIIIIPKTNFYKNIETHLDYLELDNVGEVFEDEELVDHFIFSQRLTFFARKARLYNHASAYQKLFGIGYLRKNKPTKMIEMDYFDIYYSHGLIGFLVFFSIVLYILYKILKQNDKMTYERYMTFISLILIIFLSFFTGHIITAPAVSLIVIVITLSLEKRKKKDLLFASKSLIVGGIEKAQVILLDNIDYNKYNVTLVLEEKQGAFLDKVNSNVLIKELKVSSNSNVVIRKIINATRKIVFKVFNYHNYDFSCCYTTYSYSSNKVAKMASMNNAFYVHSDYKYVYNNDVKFKEFFDSRKVSEYRRIIFVSNEAKASFISYYPELSEKSLVLNNFIDINAIISNSKEKISEQKPKDKKLFVFVGRLDDSSKKLRRAIKIIKELKDTELWVVGNGPDRKLYEDYAKELKVTSKVKFLGQKVNPYPYMKEADYIILTSDYEGFPVIYLESLVLEKEIITTIETSDDEIDIKDYAHIVSKDEVKMLEEIQKVIKTKSKRKKINLEEIQKKRVLALENLFNN